MPIRAPPHLQPCGIKHHNAAHTPLLNPDHASLTITARRPPPPCLFENEYSGTHWSLLPCPFELSCSYSPFPHTQTQPCQSEVAACHPPSLRLFECKRLHSPPIPAYPSLTVSIRASPLVVHPHRIRSSISAQCSASLTLSIRVRTLVLAADSPPPRLLSFNNSDHASSSMSACCPLLSSAHRSHHRVHSTTHLSSRRVVLCSFVCERSSAPPCRKC